MTTKCARLTECDVQGDDVIYNAKSCNGNEKFSYNGSWDTLGYDHCLENHLLQVDYDPEKCSKDNFCEADNIALATDTQCLPGSCVIW